MSLIKRYESEVIPDASITLRALRKIYPEPLDGGSIISRALETSEGRIALLKTINEPIRLAYETRKNNELN